MYRKTLIILTLVAASYLTGCASVPMGSLEDDKARKTFSPPSQGTAGLYIYRNSNFGAALTKAIYVDGQFIGESGPKTYFYKKIKPGKHTLSTESEFGNNNLEIDAEFGQNYFVSQYIKLGVFVGGANMVQVSNEVGMRGVLECKLAKELKERPKVADDSDSEY